MADTKLNETFEQIKTLIIEMPLMKKVSILFTIGLSVGVLVFLTQLSSQSSYQVLFSNLEPEDMASISSALEKYEVSYQVQSDTHSILVSGDKVLPTRLKLAKDGLPEFGGVGFELFDDKTFGMTDFEQRLNYQRALQGELQRTINEFKEIEDSRVHLVIPDKSAFVPTHESATASVVLKMEKDQKVSEETVQSIVHLVSTSVPGLDPKNINVADSTGVLLTPDSSDPNSGGAVARKRGDVETGYAAKIRTLLEPIVGSGKVKVQVTADLDFTNKETTEEKFDPESVAVRSETKTRSKEDEQSGAEGSGNKNRDNQNETVSYEVSKQVQHIVHPTGQVKSLSVAVIVDGLYTKNPDGTQTYAARTPEEIKNFEDIIKSAIGFNDKRGDQLKVMNLAFQNADEAFSKDNGGNYESFSNFSFYITIIVNVVIALIALLIIFFVVKPVLSAWSEGRNKAMNDLLAQGSQQVLSTGQVREQLEKKAMTDPADMVNVLRRWLE